MLAIAAPPIPGGAITCYGILITQLGIPAEGLVMATTLDFFADFFMSTYVVLHLEMELVREASILRMLDKKVRKDGFLGRFA